MTLPEAQAILREHGLEDFPRPWIIDQAHEIEAGTIRYTSAGFTRWSERIFGAKGAKLLHFGSMNISARETALLMGWKPEGNNDGPDS